VVANNMLAVREDFRSPATVSDLHHLSVAELEDLAVDYPPAAFVLWHRHGAAGQQPVAAALVGWLADELNMVVAGHPHPGQRFTHNWVPVGGNLSKLTPAGLDRMLAAVYPDRPTPPMVSSAVAHARTELSAGRMAPHQVPDFLDHASVQLGHSHPSESADLAGMARVLRQADAPTVEPDVPAQHEPAVPRQVDDLVAFAQSHGWRSRSSGWKTNSDGRRYATVELANPATRDEYELTFWAGAQGRYSLDPPRAVAGPALHPVADGSLTPSQRTLAAVLQHVVGTGRTARPTPAGEPAASVEAPGWIRRLLGRLGAKKVRGSLLDDEDLDEYEDDDLGWDDEDDTSDDEATAVVLAALDEWSGRVEAEYNPALHLHYPARTPGGKGGEFRPMVDRLLEALRAHEASGGTGNPFAKAGIKREPLRRAAVARGISLPRGASEEHIARALLHDAGHGEAPSVPAKKAAKKAAPGAGKAAELRRQADDLEARLKARPLRRAGMGDAQWQRVVEQRQADRRHVLELRDRAGRLERSPNAEQAARTRQANIDKARTVADPAADIHEMLADGATPDLVREHLDTWRARGLPPDVADEWSRLADNPQALLAAVDVTAARHGLARVAAPGDVVGFDVKQHQFISPELNTAANRAGAVHVVRPGYTYTRDGEQIQLSKAVVEPATPEEIGQARTPVKKALPAALPGTPLLVPATADSPGRRGHVDGQPLSVHDIIRGDEVYVDGRWQRVENLRVRDRTHISGFDANGNEIFKVNDYASIPVRKTVPAKVAKKAAKREADAEDALDHADGLWVAPRHPALNTPYAAGKELDRSHNQDQADDALEGLTLAELREVAQDKGVNTTGRTAEQVRREIVNGLTPKRRDWPPTWERDPGAVDRALRGLAKVDWSASEGLPVDPGRGVLDHLTLREHKELARRIGLPDALKSKAEWGDAIQAVFAARATSPTKKAVPKAPTRTAAEVVADLEGLYGFDPGTKVGTKADAHAILDGLDKPRLVEVAKHLAIPNATRMSAAALRDEIVQATIGKRRDSIAIRGFTGARPGMVGGELVPEPAPGTADLASLSTEARRDALDLRKVDELKALLRERGLPVTGRKRDLVDRLVEHMATPSTTDLAGGEVKVEQGSRVFGNSKRFDVIVGGVDVGTVHVVDKGESIGDVFAWGPSNSKWDVPPTPRGATFDEAVQHLVDAYKTGLSTTPTQRAHRHVEKIVPTFEDDRLLEMLRPRVVDPLTRSAELAPHTMMSLTEVRIPPAGSRMADQFGWGESARYDHFARALTLSPHWRDRYTQLVASNEESHRSGWFTPTPDPSSPAGTIAHEFGHHVVKTISFGEWSRPQLRAFMPEVERSLGLAPGTLWDPKGSGDKDLINDRLAQHSKVITERISGYAGQPSVHTSEGSSSQFDEMLAEIWQEYSTMGKKARPHIKTLGEIMRTLAEERASQ
jgi:SAP domain